MKLTPKGMRDFPPEEAMIREEARDRIIAIYRRYGFVPMETPALEYLETLRAKAGEAIDQQIFVLSDERLALRFDLTVPLARVASSLDVPKPFKRYAIGPVWRKEEPQKGRFREFWQADVDIIGCPGMRAEAELLSVAREVCAEFGFSKPKILLNNRKILDALAKKMDFEDKKDETLRLLDKVDKVGRDVVESEVVKLLGQRGEELLDVVSAGKDNEEKLKTVEKTAKEGVEELREIISLCDFDIGIDLSLVRGLGYYTGPVYEVKLSDEIGTVMAGGRYDGLLGVYGRQDYATGISVGIERLITLILEKRKGRKKTCSRIFVACATPELYKNAVQLAAYFRKNGIETETDLNGRNLRKQFEYVNSLSIPYAVIIGKRELESGKFTLRDMASGKEESLREEEIAARLKA
ncbi:histidine--tRNA ligase [Candidatus Micrarchaeota archaeon]|nr:histidine--tRNA ligase [Candidatus Micrarchaeota archaeon]